MADQVRRDAQTLSADIFADWQDLNTIIQRHEETIRKRWLKKTRGQRSAILLNAWGKPMSDSHRPDLQSFYNNQAESSLEAYKWPYINLEDLLKPKVLLIFLNARGRNPPHAFFHADLESCHFGIVTHKVDRLFLNEYTMLFLGRTTPETYGELVSWDDNPDAFDWSMKGIEPIPGEGLLLLQVQQRIWRFLLACAREILHEISKDAFADAPIVPEPQPISLDEPGVTTLASVSMEAPYRTPASLDLSRLKDILSAKKSAAADHIWFLREDPGYFADRVTESQEHEPEMLLDVDGKKHGIHKLGLTPVFWNRVLSKVVTDAYLSLTVWDTLCNKVSDLQTLLQEHTDEISPLKELPDEVKEAFQSFRFCLEQFTAIPIALLQQIVPPSPPMRHLWYRENMSPDPNSTKFRTILKPNLDKDPARERLMWIYTTLWDEEQRFLAGLHTLMDELDRLTTNEPKAKELQSARMMDVIGDLSVASECLHQLSLFYPWSKSIDYEMETSTDELVKKYGDALTPWYKILSDTYPGTTLADLGDPTTGRFTYPIARRRNKENVTTMRLAERNLDAFWAAIDKHFSNKYSKSENEVLKQVLGDRILQRTPPYTEPPPKPKEPIAAPTPLPYTLPLQPLSQNARDLPFHPQKPKHKTRKSVHFDLPSLPPSPPPPQIQSFTVDKRAKKVFSTLFFTPNQADTPGGVAWADFLYAMKSAGFGCEKLYGSVWRFSGEDTGDTGRRSIIFHEPHPVNKIEFWVGRRIGRRLGRTFGWDGETFVLG